MSEGSLTDNESVYNYNRRMYGVHHYFNQKIQSKITCIMYRNVLETQSQISRPLKLSVSLYHESIIRSNH